MNPEPDRDLPAWLPPEDYSRVVVSCTARWHGRGPRRLPDRRDDQGVIGAVFVESADEAAAVFSALDVPGRTIFVDVERKQEVDLVGAALAAVRVAELAPAKPNDVTIRSLDVMVTQRFGVDLRGVSCAVVGTGNLGFKAALLLAERDARVAVHGRNVKAAADAARAINAILPRHASHQVRPGALVADHADGLADGDLISLLVTAVSAAGAVGSSWVPRLRDDARVVDIGIDNLSPEFLEAAMGRELEVIRLDTRATTNQLNRPAPEFVEAVFGRGRIGDVPVISGGIIGRRGSVVVDSQGSPTRVLGVANGRGGLLRAEEMTECEKGVVDDVQRALPDRQARP